MKKLGVLVAALTLCLCQTLTAAQPFRMKFKAKAQSPAKKRVLASKRLKFKAPVKFKPITRRFKTAPFFKIRHKPVLKLKFKCVNVDLRPEINNRRMWVRNQNPRPTCSVHALTFLQEWAYWNIGWKHGDLSEEYLNYTANLVTGRTDDGDFFHNLHAGFAAWGQYPEQLIPYQTTYDPHFVPHASYSAVAKKWPRFQPEWIKPNSPNYGCTMAQIERAVWYLDKRIPVAAGLRWPRGSSGYQRKTILGVDVLLPVPVDKTGGGHSIAFVGYGKHTAFPGGGYFIFRNSYGKGWGDEGYGYMSFEYVRRYVYDLVAYQ